MRIRRAESGDVRAVWEWRNDPVTREMQPDPTPIPYEVHVAWFTAMLDDPNRVMFIGVVDVPVGYARFNVRDQREKATAPAFEVDIAVAPDHRGKGYGTELIRLATAELGGPVLASVKAENAASRRAFTKAGYTIRTFDDVYQGKYMMQISYDDEHPVACPPGWEDRPYVDHRGMVLFAWDTPLRGPA